MKVLITIILVAISLGYVNADEYIDDPVSYYFNVYHLEDEEKLLKCSLDINNDGRKELFLSPEKQGKDNHGQIWTAFVNDGVGWKVAKVKVRGVVEDHGAVQFHSKACHIGHIEEVGGIALVSYAKGRKGSLSIYKLDNGIIEVSVIKNFVANGKDSERYQELFSGEEPTIEKLDQP